MTSKIMVTSYVTISGDLKVLARDGSVLVSGRLYSLGVYSIRDSGYRYSIWRRLRIANSKYFLKDRKGLLKGVAYQGRLFDRNCVMIFCRGCLWM